MLLLSRNIGSFSFLWASTVKARNPHFQAAVAAIFHSAPFVNDLGISLGEVAVGRVESQLALAPRHLQHDGFVHAAVQTAIADHTAGAAAYSVIEAEQLALTMTLTINLLRPAQGRALHCVALVLRAGRRAIVVESEVSCLGDGASTLVAKATVTLAVLTRHET